MSVLIYTLKGEFNDLIVYDDHVTLVYKGTLRLNHGAQKDFWYANLSSVTFEKRGGSKNGKITFFGPGLLMPKNANWWPDNVFFITLGYVKNEDAEIAYNHIMRCFRAEKGWTEGGNEAINEETHAARAVFSRLLDEYLSSHESIDIQTEAKLFAKAVELGVLKAPLSAVFCDLSQMPISESNGVYTVSGCVDSQNSYGALIRGNYTYHVRKTTHGWICEDQFVSIEKKFNNWVALWVILGIIGTVVTGIITFLEIQQIQNLF